MNYKILVLLICSYLLAISINLMPSLKHPDLNMNIFNLLVTILFLLALLMYSKKGDKKLKLFSILGAISGVLVFLIKMIENTIFDYAILDAIASVQYPFYLIFTTPLFGANILFDLNYATFSLLTSLFYILVLVLTVYFKNSPTQNV